MLNHRSGVFGLAGEIDFRRLHEMIESGDSSAKLAYDVYIHRLRKYIGAYLAVLGHTDVLSFTAGIGEKSPSVRRDALAGMGALGIELDERRNAGPASGARWRWCVPPGRSRHRENPWAGLGSPLSRSVSKSSPVQAGASRGVEVFINSGGPSTLAGLSGRSMVPGVGAAMSEPAPPGLPLVPYRHRLEEVMAAQGRYIDRELRDGAVRIAAIAGCRTRGFRRSPLASARAGPHRARVSPSGCGA